MTDQVMSKYSIGELVPFRFDPGIVVASYFVSLIGAATTVELLHRRKAGRAILSWAQLLGCSVSFGLVAIWCMHFVGNRAIIMGDGSMEIQLYYNAGYTALSVFLPIIFLFFGFTIAEHYNRSTRALYIALVPSGFIAGLAIVGMHYIGNLGTSNYRLINEVNFIVGAAAIAVGACWISLTLFFHFKQHWINSLWRRMMCATLLAGAVSGMHWVASIGTKYQLLGYHQGSGASRNTNLIVAVVMSLCACVVCVCFAFLYNRRQRQLADRAQHVVLASATFDSDGRLLVTQEGLMPCQKITKQYNQRSFDDEFNTSHPVFQWIYRVSYNWTGVADIIPAMRSHLRATGNLKDLKSGGSTPLSFDEAHTDEGDYPTIFRERFCVAAADLADNMQMPLQKLGFLSEDILMTGTSTTEFKNRKTKVPQEDVEAGKIIPALFGKGQLLFLVRRVDRAETLKLMSMGYRFAQMEQVGDTLAKSMQVKKQDLAGTIDKLRRYSRAQLEIPQPGTYLACFALRAAVKTSSESWKVLVSKDTPYLLPSLQLFPEQPNAWQMQIITRMDGMTVTHCIQHLTFRMCEETSKEVLNFMEHLLDRITSLRETINESFFNNAKLSARLIKTPSQPTPDQYGNRETSILAFWIILDVHYASLRTTESLDYTPMSFFSCRQRVYDNSPDHSTLARRNHREFGSILSRQKESSLSAADSSRRPSMHNTRSIKTLHRLFASRSRSPRDSAVIAPDNSSERELVQMPSRSSKDESHGGTHAFGGIMVSQDITVDADSKDHSHVELQQLGITSEAGVAGLEEPTFADELFGMAKRVWQREH